MSHTHLFLTLSISTIALYAADPVPSAHFLSKEPVIAAVEIKVIDLMLSRAVQEYDKQKVEQKIEKELYSYEQEDLNDYGDDCGAVQTKDIPCLFFKKEKFVFDHNVKEDQNKDYLLLKSIFKTDTIGMLPFYVKSLGCGVEEIRTAAVLVARAPRHYYVYGLKPDALENFSEWHENPSIFVQVLIDKHNDAAQHKANKDYLLARLCAVYSGGL